MTMHDHTPPSGGLYLIWLSDSYYYGGRTTCYKRRWATHLRNLKRGTHENTRMQNTYDKYGVFRTEVVDVGDRDLVEAEQEWLDKHFRTAGCMNISKSAAGGCTSRSEESRRRMSDTRKSRPDLMEQARQSIARNRLPKGYTATPEHRANNAAAQQGRKQSPETIAKRAAAHRGRKNTPETIARMSESAKRRAAEHPTEHGAETRALISRQQTGRICINNGTTTRRLFPDEADPLLAAGWVRGMPRRK
jgi:group I intron endonuclease